MKIALASLLIFALVNTPLAQNSPPHTVSNCVVAGQVIQKPGSLPVGKVHVRLTMAVPGEPVESELITGADGKFKFENVNPGSYEITLERNGFVSPNHQPGHYSSPVSVKPGQVVDGLVFRVEAASAVAGKIVDEDGDPVQDVVVTAARTFAGVPSTDAAQATTNDLGDFRIAGLPAGKYLVWASVGTSPVPVGENASKQMKAYAVTYFPGVIERTKAATVEIQPGDSTTASFALIPSHTYRIRGVVSGLTLSNGTTLVLRSTDGTPNFTSGEVDRNGKFEIGGLFPGSYRATLASHNGEVPKTVSLDQRIEIISNDTDNVYLVPAPSGEVHGRIRTEDGKKIDWSGTLIALMPDAEDDPTSPPPVAESASDGSFQIPNVPADHYHVVLASQSENLLKYMVQAVNLTSKDVGDSGFTTGAGTYALDIVASQNGATIEGKVVDDKNEPLPGVQVICLPDPRRYRRPDAYQQVETDQNGHFRLRGLTGEYRLLAVEDAPHVFLAPDSAKNYEGLGETVKVENGEHKNVVLKLTAI